MKCCGQTTDVTDSRDRGDYQRRRRECKICHRRFTTCEIEVSETTRQLFGASALRKELQFKERFDRIIQT